MRILVAVSLGIAFGIFTFAKVAGLAGPSLVAGIAGVLAAALVAWAIGSGRVLRLEPEACPRWLKVLGMVATLVALVAIGRLTMFMVDPGRPEYSSVPNSMWEVGHSCVSAYFVAARAASHVPNVYADSLYSRPDDDPRGLRKAKTIGPFKIDVYEYPPPFLLLPRLLRLMFPEFTAFRAMWFALNGSILLLAMVVLARALGPGAGTRALLLTPLVWASLPMLSMLQKGNVQGVMIALPLLAMVLFEKRRFAAGGALLAYATVSKLFPGVLIVYLVVRREWRAVGWTVALSVVLALLTIMDTGWTAVTSFLAHLPGLVGGEAFPAFRNPVAMAINFSVPGLIFKLGLFGVPGMKFAAMKIVGWIYTLILLAVVVTVARRPVEESRRPLAWLAILVLATLRSPFLPQAYAAVPPLMLLVLLGGLARPTTRTLAGVLLGWLALNIFWPMDWPMDPRLLAVITLVPQALTAALAIVALRRSRPTPAGFTTA